MVALEEAFLLASSTFKISDLNDYQSLREGRCIRKPESNIRHLSEEIAEAS